MNKSKVRRGIVRLGVINWTHSRSSLHCGADYHLSPSIIPLKIMLLLLLFGGSVTTKIKSSLHLNPVLSENPSLTIYWPFGSRLPRLIQRQYRAINLRTFMLHRSCCTETPSPLAVICGLGERWTWTGWIPNEPFQETARQTIIIILLHHRRLPCSIISTCH